MESDRSGRSTALTPEMNGIASTEYGRRLRALADVSNAVMLLDRLITEALHSLHGDLPPWYEREHEIVSLFAFGHLVPIMLREGIDLAQLDIEGRMPQIVPKNPAGPQLQHRRVRRDLVLWAKRHDGYWRVRGNPDHPFAVMEWKLSIEKRTPKDIRDDYETDINWLKDNSSLMQVGYGVLVEWPDGKLRIECARVENGAVNRRFLVLPSAAGATTAT